jgi:hypothetical protein
MLTKSYWVIEDDADYDAPTDGVGFEPRGAQHHASPVVLEVLGGLAFLTLTAGMLALIRFLGARSQS